MYVQALILVLALAFGKPAAREWRAASRLADERQSTWYKVWESLDVDPLECEAIIFPELIRYNRIFDVVETGALGSLYVRNGVNKADYSVGAFQMKPSFVEELEREWMKTQMRVLYQLYFVKGDTPDLRDRRFKRITDEQWQCVYIGIFVRLMLLREPSLLEMDPEERVRYLSTAYNSGFRQSLRELETKMGLRLFHLEYIKFPDTVCYCYSELAARRYRELKRK